MQEENNLIKIPKKNPDVLKNMILHNKLMRNDS